MRHGMIGWVLGMVLLLSALAGWAQQRGAGPDGRGVPGRIIEVDARRQVAKIALYLRAPSPDAPGTIPDEMVQQAAVLNHQAARLEAIGKTEEARRARKLAEEMLRWREIVQEITPRAGIPLVAVQRSPIAKIATGIRVRVLARGQNGTNGVPGQLMIIRDVVQVGDRLPAGIMPHARAQRSNEQFFTIIGEVTAVAPLAVTVNERTVTLATPPQFGFIEQVPLTLKDIQPGQRIMARAELRGPLEIAAILRIIVLVNHEMTLPDDTVIDG